MLLTQVGGQATKNNSLFIAKYKLKKAGLAVAHPLNDGFALVQGRYFTFNPQKWQHYEVELDYFESIRQSDLHVVCNDSPLLEGGLDAHTSLSILFAMQHKKPIVLTRRPTLALKTDLFMLHALHKRLAKLIVLNLRTLSSNELRSVVASLPQSVEYDLTQQEIALLKLRLKSHFRHLLHPHLQRRTFFAAIQTKPKKP